MNTRQARWAEELSYYDFAIGHKGENRTHLKGAYARDNHKGQQLMRMTRAIAIEGMRSAGAEKILSHDTRNYDKRSLLDHEYEKLQNREYEAIADGSKRYFGKEARVGTGIN